MRFANKFGKGENEMDKNEILKKAQNERIDEMEVQIRDKAIKWTYLAMVIAAAIFSFIRESQGLPIMDLCATVCFSVFVGQMYRYVKIREKSNLFMAVITLIVGIISTVRFIMGH